MNTLFRKRPTAQQEATPEAGAAVIDGCGVVKTYLLPSGDFTAVAGVDLRVGAGEFVTVVGHRPAAPAHRGWPMAAPRRHERGRTQQPGPGPAGPRRHSRRHDPADDRRKPTTWQVVGIASDFGTQGTAYVTDREYANATSSAGQAQMLRIITRSHDPADRQAVLGQVEHALAAAGIGVEQSSPSTRCRRRWTGTF